MKLRDRIFWILKGILFGIFFAALFSLVVRALWNWLCPELFHLPPLGVLQAFGLVILSRLLLGHFAGNHPSPHRPWFPRRGPLDADDPRRDISHWGKYGTWWKAEGRDRYYAWLQEGKDASDRERS